MDFGALDGMNAALLRASRAGPAPQRRHQPHVAPQLAAQGRRCARRLPACPAGGSGGSDDEDELPPEPIVPKLVGRSVSEAMRLVDRYWAESDAYWAAVERHDARARARKTAQQPPQAPAPPPPPAAPPLASLARCMASSGR